MSDLIDETAKTHLRELLAKLEAGEVFITSIAVDDDEKCGIALAWKFRKPSAENAAAPAAILLREGAPCPVCGGRVTATTTALMCASCGARGQLPPA